VTNGFQWGLAERDLDLPNILCPPQRSRCGRLAESVSDTTALTFDDTADFKMSKIEIKSTLERDLSEEYYGLIYARNAFTNTTCQINGWLLFIKSSSAFTHLLTYG
jgi:hypothetical protein